MLFACYLIEYYGNIYFGVITITYFPVRWPNPSSHSSKHRWLVGTAGCGDGAEVDIQ